MKIPVCFPFGFGLSYTSFTYSDLKITGEGVHCQITNSGDVDGAEIVQLYVSKSRDGHAGIFRPALELKGFEKVFLHAGETREVFIPFDKRTFRYYDVKQKTWMTEGGTWEIRVGSSVEDIRLQGTWKVEGSCAEDPYANAKIDCYRTGKVTAVTDDEFAAVLGHPIPSQKIVIDRNIAFNQLNHGRSPIFWVVWLVMTLLKKMADASEKPNLNLLFIYNMPIRGLAKMTGGFFSIGMVDALVMEIKGFWIIGLVRFVYELIKNQIVSASIRKKLSAHA